MMGFFAYFHIVNAENPRPFAVAIPRQPARLQPLILEFAWELYGGLGGWNDLVLLKVFFVLALLNGR